jgi:hypothetical protein
MTKPLSLKERILAVKLPIQIVKVQDWDNLEVGVKMLSINERTKLLTIYLDNANAVKAYTDDQALPVEEQKGLEEVKPLDQFKLQLMLSLVDPASRDPIFAIDDHALFDDIGFPTIQWLSGIFLKMNVYQEENDDSLKKTSG